MSLPPADTEKRPAFYVEFVVLTIASLVAANIWTKLVVDILNKYKVGTRGNFITAIGITAICIIMLVYLFSNT